MVPAYSLYRSPTDLEYTDSPRSESGSRARLRSTACFPSSFEATMWWSKGSALPHYLPTVAIQAPIDVARGHLCCRLQIILGLLIEVRFKTRPRARRTGIHRSAGKACYVNAQDPPALNGHHSHAGIPLLAPPRYLCASDIARQAFSTRLPPYGPYKPYPLGHAR
ncbi:hypothetical protein BD309DRAFT_105608 [Dichomitus squalens]|nr:hypothetical protein BD309DRAFT_105608 [Dichomitus squalens]